MPLTQLAPPYPIFTDKNGDPLDAGFIYFGEPNLNPETNPITVYYDRGFTQPVAQPVRTSNGYVMRNGSPALIYADSQFSVTVRNKNSELVIYSPVGFGIAPGIPFATFENAARDVAALLADTQFTYAAGVPNTIQVAPGDILRTLAEGFAYEVAASGATDQHVTTAGGVKLYALPSEDGVVNIKAVGAVGDGVADESAAYLAASAACGLGGTIYFPPGTYLIDYKPVSSGRAHVGVKDQSIIKPLTIDTESALFADSGSASSFVEGVSFQDITFMSMATPTFSEFRHLIILQGCKDWFFEGCSFVGFRGDGLYIGGNPGGGAVERHNVNIHVKNCFFDGVNNQNRNAISVIDVDGLWISGCDFRNCTQPAMPGAIDLEPNNNAFHVIKNVWIENNRFLNIGGNIGVISLFLRAIVPLAENINICNNTCENSIQTGPSGFFHCNTNRSVLDTDIDININLTGNVSRASTTACYILSGVKGLSASGNYFSDFASGVGTDLVCRNISISDTFVRTGTAFNNAVDITSAHYLDFSGSSFEDCTNGVAGSSVFRFRNGTSSNVRLNNIQINNPAGNNSEAVVKLGSHTFDPATNQHFLCDWGSLFNGFEAHESDSIFTSYTPIIGGSTVVGAGTYTVQFGRWQKSGKRVTFFAEVVQSSHTGTGFAQISLPIRPLSTVRLLIGGSALVDGATTVGGHDCVIFSQTVLDGVTGCVRFVQTGTGAVGGITIPAGAATYRISGSYIAQ
jgi:hypothetical protein